MASEDEEAGGGDGSLITIEIKETQKFKDIFKVQISCDYPFIVIALIQNIAEFCHFII